MHVLSSQHTHKKKTFRKLGSQCVSQCGDFIRKIGEDNLIVYTDVSKNERVEVVLV